MPVKRGRKTKSEDSLERILISYMRGWGSFASFNTVGAHPCVRLYNMDKER